MATHTRKRTPGPTELSILDKSRRRCALCFQLVGDLSEKRGQIAHLDGNPANVTGENLAWLCLEHHSLYDSTTSQHKNYTMAEVKAARGRLYEAIENDDHLKGRRGAVGGVETDRAQLADLVAIMAANPGTSMLLREYDFGGGAFARSDLEPLRVLTDPNRGAENEFVDDELEGLRITFINAALRFLSLVAINTFPTNLPGDYSSVAKHWVDDELYRKREAAIKDLNVSGTVTAESYDALVRRARKKLAP